jgi:hypothetical protein
LCMANSYFLSISWISQLVRIVHMRELVVLFLHLLATVVRLAGPGGARAVVAESLLVKQQLLILNRSRKRSRTSTELIASSSPCVRCSCATDIVHSAARVVVTSARTLPHRPH